MKSTIKAIDSKVFGGGIRKTYLGCRGAILSLVPKQPEVPSYSPLQFEIAGEKIKHFVHNHNVNHPPYRMTERSIELAVADIFLRAYARDDVAEVGAVTPYYWPHRIRTVVDPMDKNPLVSHSADWMDYHGSHKAILSISTFEHIGLDDYGLDKNPQKGERAIEKLFSSGADFLVTWPGGYNPELDALARKRAETGAANLIVLQRNEVDNDWRWIPDYRSIPFDFKYGPLWANTLLMLYRGPAEYPHQVSFALKSESDR